MKKWQSNKKWSKKIGSSLAAVASSIAGYLGLTYIGRTAVKKAANKVTKRFMVDTYHENLWELVHASTRVGYQTIVETNLRAKNGEILERPLGSGKKTLDFDNLMFDMAQLRKMPTSERVAIDTKVVIGPNAQKPMVIQIPIMVAGMAYGLSLSAKAKIALAKGTAQVGTATNTGEGAFLQEERNAAKKLIIQYPRGAWNHKKNILNQGDMIEIQIGQGAIAGVGHATKSQDINFAVKRKLGLKLGQDANIPSVMEGIKKPQDYKKIVDQLKEMTGGVPIGIKIGASKYLEEDLAIAVELGVDVIAVDGAQAGSVGSAPILQDDFGLPTMLAVSRAGKYFQKNNLQGKISLIISGGLYEPGDFLKAIALGADAVSIGTMALFAMSHTQVLHALPFEPPTQIVWASGKYRDKFNVDQGANNLAKYLNSCTLEMQEGIRALGKKAVSEVNKEDLMALDPFTAAITEVDLAYEL